LIMVFIMVAFNGIFLSVNGLFMLVAPLVWYYFVPGVTDTGFFNQHFIRDIGIIQLFLGVAFGIGMIRPERRIGLWAAATHGLLRTGHAVRSLAVSATPQRLHELAEGLGHWAARYQVLPGRPSGRHTGSSPSKAVQYVARVHGPDFEAQGSIVQQVKGLDEQPEFAQAVDLVDTAGDLSWFISELTETCAGLYLANPKGFIAFVHTVTAPSALRLLAPYLTDADARLAARYAWQACAAIYAWYSTTPPPATADLTPPTEAPEALIDRAVVAGGAHTIKFTEACLREYALHPKPVYLVAARDAAERVGGV